MLRVLQYSVILAEASKLCLVINVCTIYHTRTHLIGQCIAETFVAVSHLSPSITAHFNRAALLQLDASELPLAVVERTSDRDDSLVARGAPAETRGAVHNDIKVLEAKVANHTCVEGLAPVTEGQKPDLSSSC